jgi:hypothetical protein
MPSKTEIVFRRKVRRVWLEEGMALAAKGVSWVDARLFLAKEISAENQGIETISKVLEHIKRIWFEPPIEAYGLHSDALKIYSADSSRETKLILNWGMSIAAYPFVGSTGEALGRLLKLQNDAFRSDVQRRLREQYGDRDFVNRITRYNISSFLDWGIIKEIEKRGTYVLGKKAKPNLSEYLAWLSEAALISLGKTQIAFLELCNHPILFPVELGAININLMHCNQRLRVERQNLADEHIFLKT